MTWFSWLGRWLRPRSVHDKEHEPDGLTVRVPPLRPDRQDSSIPRFSGPASDPDTIGPSGEAPDTGRVAQAFTPAQPVADLRRFAGRRELLDRTISAIEDHRMHVVVHGDRGMGKTSLLHILAILARDARYLVRYTSCSEGSDFDEVFRGVAAEIPLLYHSDYDPTSAEAEQGRTLADTFSDRPLTPTTLSEAFTKVAGTRLLVILDEFDRASSAGFRKSVAELIKNLSDRAARVQLVIGGVATNLTELIAHIPSIRRNVLGISVDPMADDELLQILDNAQAIAGIAFRSDARALLVRIGNGSPYLVGLLGQYAARGAHLRGSSEIQAGDVHRAVVQVDAELRSRLAPAAVEQLETLQRSLASATLRRLGGYAQRHFGEVPHELRDQLAAALRQSAPGGPRAPEGPFRFSDDSLPTLLWLKSWRQNEELDQRLAEASLASGDRSVRSP